MDNVIRSKRAEYIGMVCIICGNFKYVKMSDWFYLDDERPVCRECVEEIDN